MPGPCSRCSRRAGLSARAASAPARAIANHARRAAVAATPPTLQPFGHQSSGPDELDVRLRNPPTIHRPGGGEEERRDREHESGRDPAARLPADGSISRSIGYPSRRRTTGTGPRRGRCRRSPGWRSGGTTPRTPAASAAPFPRRGGQSRGRPPPRTRRCPRGDHDEVGDREQKAEEDGDARSLEVVRDDEADRQGVLLVRRLVHARILTVPTVGRRLRWPGLGIARCPTPPSRPMTWRAPPRRSGARSIGRRRSARGASARPHLKAELFQRTGSFKARGALNRVRALSAEERERGVIGVRPATTRRRSRGRQPPSRSMRSS